MNEQILEALRWQAWERAKGELRSMLNTFYGDQAAFGLLSMRIENFIKVVEDNR